MLQLEKTLLSCTLCVSFDHPHNPPFCEIMHREKPRWGSLPEARQHYISLATALLGWYCVRKGVAFLLGFSLFGACVVLRWEKEGGRGGFACTFLLLSLLSSAFLILLFLIFPSFERLFGSMMENKWE